MRILKFFKLIGYYLIDLVKSNLIVAYDIITPGEMGTPQIIKLEVQSSKDIHLFVLTCLITMSPGSLCLKISEDKKYIWLHYLYPNSIDGLIDTIKNKYEKTIMEIF
jgi:multicomponent Na+:H+ antiporter subunit E